MCRVEINVLGRPSNEASDDREVNRAFLKSIHHIMSNDGIAQIADITRKHIFSDSLVLCYSW